MKQTLVGIALLAASTEVSCASPFEIFLHLYFAIGLRFCCQARLSRFCKLKKDFSSERVKAQRRLDVKFDYFSKE